MQFSQTNQNAGDVNNAAEVPRMNGLVIDRLVELVKQISEAVRDELPVQMSVAVSISAGVQSVTFSARCGDDFSRVGLAAPRYSFGGCPETVAAQLIEEVSDDDIRNKLREEKLRALAKALGFSLSKSEAE